MIACDNDGWSGPACSRDLFSQFNPMCFVCIVANDDGSGGGFAPPIEPCLGLPAQEDLCAGIEAVCVESDLAFVDGNFDAQKTQGCECCLGSQGFLSCFLPLLPPADFCVDPGGGMNRNGDTIAQPAQCRCSTGDCDDYDQELCMANGGSMYPQELCSEVVGVQPLMARIPADQDMAAAWWLGVYGENCCQMDAGGTPYEPPGAGSCNDADVAVYVSVSLACVRACMSCVYSSWA